MTFGSLFAGQGGFDLAFERAGLTCRWQVEIDRDARRVLDHHWPNVPKFEDVRKVKRKQLERVDVITFGSPCQDLSVAGKRAGLKGERSGLFFEAIRIVRQLRPTFAVWENVPGAFSSHAGRDFLSAVRAFHELGARDICWRVLDARHWGVAQRRRRVFLVADFRGERAGQVLFESEGCSRNPAAGGEARSDVAPSVTPGARRACGDGSGRDQLVAGPLGSCGNGRGWNDDLDRAGAFVASTLRSRQHGEGVNPPGRGGEDDQNLVIAHTLRGEGHDAGEDGTGRGTPLVAQTLRSRQHGKGINPPGRGGEDDANLVFQCHGSNVGPMGTVRSGNGGTTGGVPFLATAVRSRDAKGSPDSDCTQTLIAFGGNNTAGPLDVSTACNASKTASGRQDFESETFIVNAAESCAKERHARQSDTARCLDQTGGFAANQGGTVAVVPISADAAGGHTGNAETPSADAAGCVRLRPPSLGVGQADDPSFTVAATGPPAVGYTVHGTDQTASVASEADVSCALRTCQPGKVENSSTTVAVAGMTVRRLTPTECLRLQGLPDDWLDLDPPLSDSAKYRMIGNSVAVPVVDWIGRRIMEAVS